MQMKLIQLRKERGLNQSDLAGVLGISTNNYGQKELDNRKFDIHEMFTIADYFNKDIGDIFTPICPRNVDNK